MIAPAEPAPRAADKPAAASPPAPRRAAAPPVVSRFGEISPAFAAAFGASVSIGLPLGARNAEARAFYSSARRSRSFVLKPALPREISTTRAVPHSRVRATLVTEPSR